MNFLFLAVFNLLVQISAPAQEYETDQTKVLVEITNLRNTDGNVSLGIYTNQADFEDENEYRLEVFSKSNMSESGTLKVEFNLPPGTYGIAYLDDENGNGEMDYGLMMPEEGFGFSNFKHSGLSKPDFEDFKFTVAQIPVKVYIQTRYM